MDARQPTADGPLPTVSYAAVRESIRSGDTLLFRWRDLLSDDTRGPYDHAAMAVWCGEVLMCAESRQRVGARMVPLSSRIADHPGAIDVYRPKASARLRSGAAQLMVLQCGHKYGWGSLAAVAWRHMPIVWPLSKWIFSTSELEPRFADAKFCSEQVIWSYRQTARRIRQPFDACRGLASQFVEPNDLYHDPTFHLLYKGLK